MSLLFCIKFIISLIFLEKSVSILGLIFSIKLIIDVAVSKINTLFENNKIPSKILSNSTFTLNISPKIFNSLFKLSDLPLKG